MADAKNTTALRATIDAAKLKEERENKSAGAKPVAGGLVRVRLVRGLQSKDRGWIPPGIYDLPADEVPASAIVLKAGDVADEAVVSDPVSDENNKDLKPGETPGQAGDEPKPPTPALAKADDKK